MSHFSAERFGLQANQENLARVKALLNSLKDYHEELGLTLVHNEGITNRYNQKVHVIVGLQGSTINPLGFQVQQGELVCQVDLDFQHYDSITKENTTSLFRDLQARMIQIRKEDAIEHSQSEADRLRAKGANVSVRVHSSY